jgi:predicted small lipoprotein YifL
MSRGRDRGHLARDAGGTPAVRLCTGFALLVLFFSLALTGCGKKGPPAPPPDEPVTFPRSYPSE